MKPGRKRGPPYERWLVVVPTSIAAQVELRLLDPLLNQPRYGARAKLIQALLAKWLAGDIEVPM